MVREGGMEEERRGERRQSASIRPPSTTEILPAKGKAGYMLPNPPKCPSSSSSPPPRQAAKAKSVCCQVPGTHWGRPRSGPGYQPWVTGEGYAWQAGRQAQVVKEKYRHSQSQGGML